MSDSTWFLVADARRARVLEYDGTKGEFGAPLGFDYVAPSSRDGDRFSDRAGRVSERKGPTRHAMEAPTAPTRQDEEDLARRIAKDLAAVAHRHQMDRLVLIAPPHMLGSLRKQLTEPTARLVAAEHGKDLSKLSDHELRERLRELLPA